MRRDGPLDRPPLEPAQSVGSGLLAAVVPRDAGATMALYSCIGFGGGFVGTVLFGFTLDSFGGTNQLAAWISSFATAGIACLIGAAVTAWLSLENRSSKVVG